LPRFQSIVIKGFGIISFVIFFLLGSLYLVSEELIVLLFSDKWLPSVELFKILVLSGFAYPLSALLVNVLSSRGNSKAFLRLEIYKKLIASVSFFILYLWGVEAFLYSLLINATLAVSLNIIFISREILLPFSMLAKPLITQMGIAVAGVVITEWIFQNMELIDIIMLIVKGSMFTALYIGLNYVLKTNSFGYFLEQMMPLIRNILVKK